MAEICTPLRKLGGGKTYTADEDGAFVIEERHTHSDILRYVIAEIGKADAIAIVETLPESAQQGAGE